MKKILGVFFIPVLILACSGKKEKDTVIDDFATAVDSAIVIDGHTAQNSLDYAGTYKGLLPCADCEKMEVELTIGHSDFTRITVLHKNGKTARMEEKGNFSWTNNGSVIVLEGITNSPNKYFVGENMLIQLDSEGNRITGESADMYILRKQ